MPRSREHPKTLKPFTAHSAVPTETVVALFQSISLIMIYVSFLVFYILALF